MISFRGDTSFFKVCIFYLKEDVFPEIQRNILTFTIRGVKSFSSKYHSQSYFNALKIMLDVRKAFNAFHLAPHKLETKIKFT